MRLHLVTGIWKVTSTSAVLWDWHPLWHRKTLLGAAHTNVQVVAAPRWDGRPAEAIMKAALQPHLTSLAIDVTEPYRSVAVAVSCIC